LVRLPKISVQTGMMRSRDRTRSSLVLSAGSSSRSWRPNSWQKRRQWLSLVMPMKIWSSSAV
jgi:hypothetical protein